MKKIKNGFTLIELLVVVLIIGILAAIAVPQYQKAVAKSQAMQGFAIIKHVIDQAEMYYLEHGYYPLTLADLDLQMPADWTGTKRIYTFYSKGSISNQKWSIVLQQGGGFGHAIHVGLISGPYQGAGFSYVFNRFSGGCGTLPQKELVCAEYVGSSDAPFKKKQGDFCVKLFKGTRVYGGGGCGDHYYRMP